MFSWCVAVVVGGHTLLSDEKDEVQRNSVAKKCSSWELSLNLVSEQEKKYSCSVLQLCIYSVVLVLVLGLIRVLVFIGIGGSSNLGEWR